MCIAFNYAMKQGINKFPVMHQVNAECSRSHYVNNFTFQFNLAEQKKYQYAPNICNNRIRPPEIGRIQNSKL